jgi:hypothetical protein
MKEIKNYFPLFLILSVTVVFFIVGVHENLAVEHFSSGSKYSTGQIIGMIGGAMLLVSFVFGVLTTKV